MRIFDTFQNNGGNGRVFDAFLKFQQITIGRNTAALRYGYKRILVVYRNLKSARDANAHQAYARQAVLVLKIFYKFVQLPGGQYLVVHEGAVLWSNFH